MAVFLLTLGCPKNEVDSEVLERKLVEGGVALAGAPEGADTLIVNTCCFIQDAKRESIEEILGFAELKAKSGGRLAVMGCMGRRYAEELRAEMPEVDEFFGLGEEERIVKWVMNGGEAVDTSAVEDTLVRPHASYAYLKIAEGCDRGCSFCVIPSVRGRFGSVRSGEVLKEAERKAAAGARELILVAQDITRYGKEFSGYGLGELVRDIASIDGEFGIRLMYVYPADVDTGFMEMLGTEEKVIKYLDIPLQHSEDRVLRLMKRRGSRKEYQKLIRRLRRMVPGIALRTTMMVGFPGETEEDFRGLLDFTAEASFDRLGAFKYSREEGTAAWGMKGKVPEEVAERRFQELMELQAGISLERNRELVGREFNALIDGFDGDVAVGRIYSQAPEIDGVTMIKGVPRDARSALVKVTGAGEYDLKAEAAR